MKFRIVSDTTMTNVQRNAAGSVVCLESVGVRYIVPRERTGSLKEYAIRRVSRRVSYDTFWALRDVSIDIANGESLGIMGRNGAGKSTLLKVVARVLRPTIGRVRVAGRVAPLLDLAAGFHPELTGRENLFLNGSLLQRTEAEVTDRFGEIVEFAELDAFIDAPLRTYSNGMISRLAFALATAWRPDVLLLDEVLAVGDEAFQRKCLARMRSYREHGTTFLFVSHDANAVREICDRAIWIDQGRPRELGAVEAVLYAYRHST